MNGVDLSSLMNVFPANIENCKLIGGKVLEVALQPIRDFGAFLQSSPELIGMVAFLYASGQLTGFEDEKHDDDSSARKNNYLNGQNLLLIFLDYI